MSAQCLPRWLRMIFDETSLSDSQTLVHEMSTEGAADVGCVVFGDEIREAIYTPVCLSAHFQVNLGEVRVR